MAQPGKKKDFRHSDPAVRALTEELVPRVTSMAHRMKKRLPHHIDVDDLIGDGLLGLAQAAAGWKAGERDAFIAYAIRRASGAMLDGLRGRDQLTRAQRRLAAQLLEAERRLTTTLGRQPEVDEIAHQAGMSPACVEKARALTYRYEHVSMTGRESILPARFAHGPEEALREAQLGLKFQRAVDALPDRLKMVLSLSLRDELTLREIGERLGVTEGRACQLRQEAVDNLRRGCADSVLPAAFADLSAAA